MTENPQKKKPLILESSDDSESSVKSEKDSGVSSPSSEKSAPKSDVPSSSSSIPLSSTPIPSSSSSNQSSSNSLKISDNLEEEYKKLNCLDENYYSKDCNKFLLKKELIERNTLLEKEGENQYLYPNLNDKDFNIKIANKQEFNDTRYDGAIHENIKEHADALAKADFELQPHQAFVKNFLSFQTPYSSLLLYHGLGSGKTCSAIGVCEEMRDYMKQMGTTKRIIIVASENVQDNFKLQLFDERKLKLVDGLWNIRACTGNKLLKEINPMNMKGMTKDKVVSQIKNLINTYYIFLGYVQFANYIIKTMNYNEEVEKQKYKKDEQRKKGDKSKIQMLKDVKIELNSRIIRRLRNEFDNRLIVIDEVHNIRKTDDNENKKVAINLELLVKSALNMRFLLLSATPMYNSYKEMIWLLNLMNTNDRRGRIEVRDIFKKNGDFKDDGEEILTRKSTGYISFVRGENPYTFPYRVYPKEFSKEHTFEVYKYPLYQMNLKPIKSEDKPEDVKSVLSLYLTKIGGCKNCGKCQYCAYKYIIYNLRNKKFSITTKTGVVRDMPDFENMESFGYTLLQTPLESLIISYPIQGLKSAIDEMPVEKISGEFAESFADNKDENGNEEEEPPGPIEGETNNQLSVKSSFSERKDSLEPEEKIVMQPKIKKPLIIQDSDDDTDELLKINKSAIESAVEKKDSDDDTEELQRDLIRKERQNLKTKKPLIIEDSSSSNKSETKEKSKTVTIKKPTMQVEISDNEESSKTLVDNSNGTLVDKSNGTLVDKSNGTLVDNSNETLVDTSTKGGKGPSIDPHQLTGKIGLERMMNYVDEKSPPVKGDFEYKKSTLDNYKRIFSRDEIGKYSSKIKSILDNIVNPDDGKVSEGVILIYSQYIDSGLIPMALALEEMGFTRYGQGVKPLFKNKPSEVVDVTTMKPPADKKKFMPARYAMITGETRLSPNNDFEVKV